MHGEYLNVARILDRTRAEGPGIRFCVWTQGCLRNCPGCCNAAMQPLGPRFLVPVRELASRMLLAAEKHGLEGVTFLGGEPLLQAQGLAAVARAAHGAGLTVMVFTGFTLEECRAEPLPGVAELLAETDILVDGPYLADRPEPMRNWIGSSNQRFHYFTGAYGPDIETNPAYRGQIEFRIEGDSLLMNGCPRTLPPWFRLKREPRRGSIGMTGGGLSRRFFPHETVGGGEFAKGDFWGVEVEGEVDGVEGENMGFGNPRGGDDKSVVILALTRASEGKETRK